MEAPYRNACTHPVSLGHVDMLATTSANFPHLNAGWHLPRGDSWGDRKIGTGGTAPNVPIPNCHGPMPELGPPTGGVKTVQSAVSPSILLLPGGQLLRSLLRGELPGRWVIFRNDRPCTSYIVFKRLSRYIGDGQGCNGRIRPAAQPAGTPFPHLVHIVDHFITSLTDPMGP